MLLRKSLKHQCAMKQGQLFRTVRMIDHHHRRAFDRRRLTAVAEAVDWDATEANGAAHPSSRYSIQQYPLEVLTSFEWHLSSCHKQSTESNRKQSSSSSWQKNCYEEREPFQQQPNCESTCSVCSVTRLEHDACVGMSFVLWREQWNRTTAPWPKNDFTSISTPGVMAAEIRGKEDQAEEKEKSCVHCQLHEEMID